MKELCMKRRYENSQFQNISLIKIMHILMLSLCFIASMILYFTTSLYYQVIISSMLIMYTIFLVTNSHIIKIVFGILCRKNLSFSQKRKWLVSSSNTNIKEIDDKRQKSVKYTEDSTHRSINLEKQKQNTQDVQDLGSSLSEIWSSHYLTKKSSTQSKGFDLQNILKHQNQIQSKTVIKQKSSMMILIDNNKMTHGLSSNIHRQNEKLYELQLKSMLWMKQNQVKHKYQVILKIIDQMVSSKLNQYTLFKENIKQLCTEYLNVALITNHKSKFTSEFEVASLNRVFPIKFQFWTFIQELLLVYTRQKTVDSMHLDLKINKKLHNFQNNIFQLMKDLQKCASSLLIKSESLIKNKNSDIKQFINLLRRNITMVEQFKKYNLKIFHNVQNQLGRYEESGIHREFKNKIFILFLFAHEINQHLNRKISIVDYWNFGQMRYSERMCQIQVKNSFDSLFPHLNISSLDQNHNIKCYNCQPGSNNYLSVILMLIHQMGKDKQLLRKSSYINWLVHEIL